MGPPLYMTETEIINLLSPDPSFPSYHPRQSLFSNNNVVLGIRILHKFDPNFNNTNELITLYRTTLLTDILDTNSGLAPTYEKLNITTETELLRRIKVGITKNPDIPEELTGESQTDSRSSSSISSSLSAE